MSVRTRADRAPHVTGYVGRRGDDSPNDLSKNTHTRGRNHGLDIGGGPNEYPSPYLCFFVKCIAYNSLFIYENAHI